VNTLQIADPSSHQRGCPTDTIPQISDSNILTENNIWSQVPHGYLIPRHTDQLTVSHKVTSTSTEKKIHNSNCTRPNVYNFSPNFYFQTATNLCQFASAEWYLVPVPFGPQDKQFLILNVDQWRESNYVLSVSTLKGVQLVCLKPIPQ
jgi:hypothetical protein